MTAWFIRHPALANLLTGITVALAVALLAAEHFRDKASGGGAASYYSQF